MRILFMVVLALSHAGAVFSDSGLYANNAYTGEIVIDGQVVGRSGNALKGSGVKDTIERKVKSFSAVTVDGAFDVIFHHGPSSLTITGDDNIIKHVLSSVTGKTLRLDINKSYSSYFPIVVNVFSPTIQKMTLKGTSIVKLVDIKTDQLTLDVIGSVDIKATGRATTLNLKLNGTGDVKARYLDSDVVMVDIDGTSNAEVTAHKKLSANITGVGDILYFGSPDKVSKQVSGVGDIEAGE